MKAIQLGLFIGAGVIFIVDAVMPNARLGAAGLACLSFGFVAGML